MRALVIDASALIEDLLRTPVGLEMEEVLRRPADARLERAARRSTKLEVIGPR